MNIPLDENHRITSDRQNFIIEKYYPKTPKNKAAKWKSEYFYPSIDGLLWGVFNHKILLSSCQTLQELAVCVKKAKEDIDLIKAAVQGTG